LSITGAKEEPAEYKMSVVNDSGEYLPPSPTEKKSFWHRSTNSTTSSNHRTLLAENEPFSISRESFESYRRSFDISARSPVSQTDSIPSRQSLDSRAARHPTHHRGAVNGNHFERPQRTEEEEEAFEDVGLNDDPKPKKKGIFSRFGDSSGEAHHPSAEHDKSPSAHQHHGFHIPGRKRGQSGQGSELGSIDGFHLPGRKRGLSGKGAELGKEERPASKGKADVVIR